MSNKETRLVNFNLPVSLINEIDELSESNRTSLVIELLKQAIAMRNVNESIRDYMYEGAKKAPDMDFSNELLRNVIDGLWI